jgi:hypothetical protein
VRNLSFNARRVIVAVLGLIAVSCLANHYLKLGFFGQFSWKAVIVSFGVLLFCLLYVGPTVDEIRSYRDKKRSSTR